ncbi:Pimeloyl-ACP methyl ester carboxylesterase [Friedmanniella luteola]|uniref:Pimeloyl-ACP methyl ester carboxylesterase n=1 Tax=Friedmanniella luteola TaxID=546871 RepID=A0A1H1SZ56_9ACTN|nr:alpha/beta hydrolase [Friedmanniella luteola]SDS53260.1 Pimeloyl-ACP methyl ester carboxylesterase [Friedmanniella luteola]
MTRIRALAAPRGRLTAAFVALIALALTLGLTLAPTSSSASGSRHRAKPTVVLVHGAFADASGFADVTNKLQKRGYNVIAPANPLRGVTSDSAYLASILATIPGPIVLAGHSYGGEVITNAATGNRNVQALVYIAAFGPEKGETAGALTAKFPGSQLTPENLITRPYPINTTTTGIDAYINPAVFRAIFCADLAPETAAAMAAGQRPGALSTLQEPSGTPAWKRIPSWYLVARQDQAIPPDAQRFMAQRMNAHTREIDSSHVAMTSHPDVVAALIREAARATS